MYRKNSPWNWYQSPTVSKVEHDEKLNSITSSFCKSNFANHHLPNRIIFVNFFLNQISLLIKLPLIALIRLYQMVSPLKQLILGPYARCRFYPSCSEYSLTCFRELPLHQAFLKSFFRISRCNPMHPGGYDPVSPIQHPDSQKLSEKWMFEFAMLLPLATKIPSFFPM